MALPFPGLDVPVVDLKTGLMTQTWYDFFKFHQKLVQLPDVSPIAPTDTQVLKYVAATKLWTPS
jgi:hypothetical protein